MKDNFLILNFDSHKPPTFKEKKGKEWIEYGTEKEWKNNFPKFLTELYNESSVHSAIINGKTNYIVGQGWTINKELPLAERMKISSFINNVGSGSLKQLTQRIVLDKKLFGGFAVQPIWSKDKKEIVELHHVEFGKIRVSADGEKYFFTSDWSVRNPESNEDYAEFVPFTGEFGTDQLIYFREYRPDLKEYPLPDYIAGINYISADIDISTFTASNTSNGFMGGTLINLFNGEPTPETAKEIERKFKRKFTGVDKAGSIVLNFSDPDKQGAEIIPLSDNGQDERFVNLNKQIKESIFTAHGSVNPVLFGVKSDGGGLGNNADEIRTASEHLQNVYITPEQNIIEDFINEIIAINGHQKCLNIIPLEPVKAQLSESVLMQIATNDELRDMAGLPPVKSEQKASSVADVLGTLSPLVATKVLDNMSAEEIRNLVGLTGSKSQTTTSEFSSDEYIEDLFFKALEETGYLDSELEMISEEFLQYNPFTFAVTEVDKRILDLISRRPSITVAELSDITGESIEDIQRRLTILKTENLLTVDDETGDIKVSEDAEEPSERLITVYKYVLRPNAPALKTESRSFCKRFTALSLTRSWTREQIDGIRNDFQGTPVNDAWENRGGWYTSPTGVTTPYCRHVWKGRTVKVKN